VIVDLKNLLVMDYEFLFYHLFYNKHYLDYQLPKEHPGKKEYYGKKLLGEHT